MNDSGSGNTSDGNERGHIRLVPLDHDEYDALADLFLGEGGYAPVPAGRGSNPGASGAPDQRSSRPGTDPATPASPASPAPPPSHTTHTPVLHLTHTLDEASIDGHEHEDTDRGSDATRVLETLRETDDQASALLAELMDEHERRERDDEASATTPTTSAQGAAIELVVLGHLPVRASLWARQYACSCARERNEVVALIRAAAGSTGVDLITGATPIGAPGSDAPGLGELSRDDLGSALATVRQVADRVILRVDEASEPALLGCPEVETITILTGADEAAVVASYRLAKTLDASLSELFEHGHGPRLKLAVMGAGRDQANDALAKLRSAVETFISRPIEIVVGAGRIDATGTTSIYRDSVAHRATHIIEGLTRAAPVGAQHASEIEPKPESQPQYMPASSAEAVPRSEPPSEPPSELGAQSNPVPGREPATEATPRRHDAHSTDSPRVHEGLSALIPGLRAIEARCPASPGVELAIDDHGCLHLLACDWDTHDALRRLYGAQSWARDHLALLLRAEPGLTIPSADRGAQSEATMHLITPEPSAVRALYDTPVRVYALARVRMGRVVAQVATALN